MYKTIGLEYANSVFLYEQNYKVWFISISLTIHPKYLSFYSMVFTIIIILIIYMYIYVNIKYIDG